MPGSRLPWAHMAARKLYSAWLQRGHCCHSHGKHLESTYCIPGTVLSPLKVSAH